MRVKLRVRATVACVALALVPLPAAASELAESGESRHSDVRLVDQTFRLGLANESGSGSIAPAAGGFVVSPRARRAYAVFGQDRRTIAAFDLDTMERVGKVDISAKAWAGAATMRELLLIDDERKRLFVLVNDTILGSPGGPLSFIDLSNSEGDAAVASSSKSARACATMVLGATPGRSAKMTCPAGVAILDADTLETVGVRPFPPLTLDAAVLAPTVAGWTFVETPVGPRIHMMLVEHGHEADTYPTGVLLQNSRLLGSTSVHYLTQFDPERGVWDWTTRLEACRGTRDSLRSPYITTNKNRPHFTAFLHDYESPMPAVYAGCYNGPSFTATIARVPLDRSGFPYAQPIEASVTETEPGNEGPPASASPGQSVFFGPDYSQGFLADPGSGRIVVETYDKGAIVWWVFDRHEGRFVGTIGGGSQPGQSSVATDLNTADGVLYAHSAATGVAIASVRGTPLAQAALYPEFALPDPNLNRQTFSRHAVVLPGGDGRGTKLFVQESENVPPPYFALEDAADRHHELGEGNDWAGRTLDLAEVEGVTANVVDGAARGFGARVIIAGGAEGIARVGSVDPLTYVRNARDFTNNAASKILGVQEEVVPTDESACSSADREVVLGFVGSEGPAVVDEGGARASGQAMLLDSATLADLEAPVSRCSTVEWESLWSKALLSRPPIAEPKGAVQQQRGVQCLAPGGEASDRVEDQIVSSLSAAVACEEGASRGWARAANLRADSISVSEVISSFRIYRDPGRGIVSRVESAARGLDIDGVARIASVSAVAESWANGRAWRGSQQAEDGTYDPNCDLERTAGTCFQRHIFGVWTPGYSCGPCGDEFRLVDGINRALGVNGQVAFRDPDPVLARGADNGFTAAIQKPIGDRFADLVLNNDLLQTVVPALEIIRFAPSNTVPFNDAAIVSGPRGRQIYQFAGVEVSSSYAIQCLLVYDEEVNTCAEAVEPPGAITVSLQDGEGEPLAGGGFEVRADVDADGVLGLVDTLLPDGACVTADDGVGTCRFENLAPGPYLVSQVAAPPGYAKSDEPFVVELGSGEDRTVAFTNVSNVSTIELKAADPDGKALAGAGFAAYPDPDADGKVAPDAQPAASCTTDESGACTMSVPAGSYVLVQTAAPGGLEGIEPVPFTFASGGQVAAVTITNYPPEAPVAPDAQPGPVYTDPVDVAPPVETVTDFEPVPSVDEPAPTVSVPQVIGGTVVQVIRAPGDALRLLARDPKQAVAWTAALALFCLAVLAIRRRQQAMALLEQ